MNTFLLSILSPFVRLIPETRLFSLKRCIYRFCGVEVAPGVRICSSAVFLGSGRVVIGRNSWIGHQAMIISGCSVTIGSDVDIAPRVFIGTGSHQTGLAHKAAGPGVQKPVVVGDGAWLCAGSYILPGVTLASMTLVGAGAIVTIGTVAPGTTMVGNPARELLNQAN